MRTGVSHFLKNKADWDRIVGMSQSQRLKLVVYLFLKKTFKLINIMCKFPSESVNQVSRDMITCDFNDKSLVVKMSPSDGKSRSREEWYVKGDWFLHVFKKTHGTTVFHTCKKIVQLFHDGGPHHTETIPLIFCAEYSHKAPLQYWLDPPETAFYAFSLFPISSLLFINYTVVHDNTGLSKGFSLIKILPN